jgi:hypothetical protein
MPEMKDLMEWIDPTQWGFGWMDARVLVIVIGGTLIIAGGRLYRLVLISPGFVGGVLLSHHYAPSGTDGMKLAIGIGAGLVGALLMHLMEQAALRLLGAAMAVGIAVAFGPDLFSGDPPWFLNYVAGAIGAIGFPMIYQRALPLLTSLAGAMAIAWALGRQTDIWILAILTVSGAIIQTFISGRSR